MEDGHYMLSNSMPDLRKKLIYSENTPKYIKMPTLNLRERMVCKIPPQTSKYIGRWSYTKSSGVKDLDAKALGRPCQKAILFSKIGLKTQTSFLLNDFSSDRWLVKTKIIFFNWSNIVVKENFKA